MSTSEMFASFEFDGYYITSKGTLLTLFSVEFTVKNLLHFRRSAECSKNF